jgi:hypothetical protein
MKMKPYRVLFRTAAVCVSMSLSPGNAFLWADPPPPAPPFPDSVASSPASQLTPGQLDSLVAPVALYPDPLISQILVASTYPLEIVQAYQWLQQNPGLQGDDLTHDAAEQDWDPSVQALVVFPDVLKRLTDNVSWTTNLGNAFLANQAGVMDAIQQMRVRAQSSGKLASNTQVNVVDTTEDGRPVVEIEPADPDVVYVPVYNPEWVWGPAPGYCPYPGWYYPVAPLGVWCLWGPAISLGVVFGGFPGWHGWGWGPRWGARTVFVNNGFINRYNFNTHVSAASGRTVWVHNPVHRMGVAYSNRDLVNRYRSVIQPRPSAAFVQHQFNPAMEREANQPPVGTLAQHQFTSPVERTEAGNVERVGDREVGSAGYNTHHSAFGVSSVGSSANVHSSRGFSSMTRARIGGSGRSGGGFSGGGSRGGGHR